jgi:nicotinamidase-related amidase
VPGRILGHRLKLLAMQKKSLVVIDIQNDITKNYKEIIDNINRAIDWAVENEIHVVYIRHYNLSDGTRTFKPNTRGSELVSDMKLVSKNIFEKSKGNALTSEDFADFIRKLVQAFQVRIFNLSICLGYGLVLLLFTKLQHQTFQLDYHYFIGF